MKNIMLMFILAICFPFHCWPEYSQRVAEQQVVVTREAIPFGFYHISHHPHQDAKRISDMLLIKEMGGDYIATPLDAGDAATVRAAKTLGLGIKLEYNNNDRQGVLNALMPVEGAAQMFGHIPGDDVDINFPNPANFLPVEAAYRSLKPEFITFASNAYIKNISRYAGLADKTGQQSYPIPSEAVSATGYHFRLAGEACRAKNTPFVAHVQLSRWKGRRYPTVAEFNVMAWYAMAYGANEILFYAFYDYDNSTAAKTVITDLATQPALRLAVKSFILKVRELEYYFLLGTRTTQNTSTGMIATWQVLNKKLTLTINHNAKTVLLAES